MTYIEIREAIRRIKTALRERTGRDWSVRIERGRATWIRITAEGRREAPAGNARPGPKPGRGGTVPEPIHQFDWFKLIGGQIVRVRSQKRARSWDGKRVFTCDVYMGGGNFSRTPMDVREDTLNKSAWMEFGPKDFRF